MRRIRDRGWATSFEETNLGVWGVAVPVLDDRGGVVCAVGIAGPSARLARDRLGDHVARIHIGAGEIARALGHHVPDVESAPARTKARGKTGGKP